ncbi:hypothetical protein I601_1248 [Nocardioides dokdonensis FR1436]|uniref:DUF2029 domain-containing protein n=1 Tax=Nocardioides dokdonensis FR1436 TaxID=1300347 RepID=A0A1A9GJ23_9ACTN|nr:glycosyltransferase 87 family protein [Nocardioides dokdonensis]ANH37690.1 hypothetical protein I601_1248 [Nocardioides dokdonensis FR1436]
MTPSSGPDAAPTEEDPLAATLSEGIGGPVGTRAGRHPWWTPLRVLLALCAVVVALGMLQKAPCYSDTWTDTDARYTQMCYSDLPYLYTGRALVERAWPYSGDAELRERYPEVMEYPVGISYWAWGTALVAQGLTGWADLDERQAADPGSLFGDPEVQREIRAFVIVNALGFALLSLLAVWLLARTHPRRPWDALWFALSPALLLTGLVNWDLLAVVLVAGALWAWSTGRPVLTGVLIGLGTATKLYPLFLLGAVLVICLRQRLWRHLALVGVSAAVAWLAANLPALLTGYEQWRVFWSFNSERGADLGSLWLVAAQAGDVALEPSTINTASLLFFAGWCAAVFALGMLAPQTPRLAQLGFLLVAGFLLVNKVYSPQYVLWLLPLAVLARPRLRDQIVWQAGEIFYFACVWWYLGGLLDDGGGGAAGFYWVAIVVRVAAELYLVGLVARDVWRPRHDPVRRTQPVHESPVSRGLQH